MDYVEKGIRDGAFEDGRLPKELDIAEQVGVSRTPVREAIKILGAAGAVEIRRGIGTFVRPEAASALDHLTVFQSVAKTATTKQLYQTRFMVERAAAEIVAEEATRHDIDLLHDANEELRQAAIAPVPDYELVTDLDIAFHKAVFSVCGNPLIQALGNLVLEQVRPWIKESHEVDGPLPTIALHEALLDAIEGKGPPQSDGPDITEAVKLSLESWRERLDRSA